MSAKKSTTRAEIALRNLMRPISPKPAVVPVDDSRARITVAPPFVDRRYTPDTEHVGEFAREWVQLRGKT